MKKISTNTRIDPVILDAVVRWLNSQGIYPTTRSAGVSEGLEAFAYMLITQNQVVPAKSFEQAVENLTERGIAWPKGSRGRKQIKDAVDTRDFKKSSRDTNDVDQEIMEEEAKRHIRELYKGKDEDFEGETRAIGKHDDLAGMPGGEPEGD